MPLPTVEHTASRFQTHRDKLEHDMAVVISLLRGVNVGGHHKIKMDALRALYDCLGLPDALTYVQSGNVIFKTRDRDLIRLGRRIEDGIERTFGFRPHVIVRTPADLRNVIARNPFAKRRGIEPNRLLVTFLAGVPNPEARDKALTLKADPEELRLDEREFYMYFPSGMARPKLTWLNVEKVLQMPGTGRNWNTVTKLLEIAEKLEASG
jgi:uncharacterized protein (DUF1697 family)